MFSLKRLWPRIAAFFDERHQDDELAEELETHRALLAEEYIQEGKSPEYAARAAALRLGGITQLNEAHRETRGLPFMDNVLQDLRYTVRTLARERGFTIFAILIVGLGIGASATVYSVIDALLLRPLPFSQPERLTWIANSGKDLDLSGQTVPVSALLDLRAQSQSFTDIAAYYAFYGRGDNKLTGEGEAERLTGIPVTQNFFAVLGIQPRMGRVFTVDEGQKNSPVVILSAGLWSRRFASDPNILGRTLRLNDRVATVIGVMPASFDFGSVFAPGTRVDLLLPLPLTPEVNRMGNTLSMVGRLKPGATVERAQAEASALSEPIRIKNNRNELSFRVTPLEKHVRGKIRPGLLVLACAVGVVMLIACANLSNLQLARATARQKEIAVRIALGASKARLFRQLLTEGIVLSSLASVFGVALAFVATRIFASLDSINLPLRETVRVDLATLGLAAALALLTGLLFSLVPALSVSPDAVNTPLKETGRSSTDGKRRQWLRGALVVSEIAFACVLLVGVGLLVRSFLHIIQTDLGFRPDQAAALRVDPSSQYRTPEQRVAYFNELLRLTRSIPGIDSAGLTDVLPLGSNRSWSAGAKGRTYSIRNPPPTTFVRIVSDGYLASMGISLRAGRDLSEMDNAAGRPVMLINETLARTLWPGEDPIGKIASYVDRDREVVGVVSDVRHLAPDQGSGCEMYLPIRQTNDYSSVDLVVRTSLTTSSLAPALRTALKPIEPNLPANEFRTLRNLVDDAVSPRRFVVFLLAGFSIFAVILASLGIYAVVSYLVAQRTHEIGIRMALGASSRDVKSHVIHHTLILAGIGVLIGTGLALLLTQSLDKLLYQVSPQDPVTFAGALLTLIAVAAIAGYLPARRASHVDPMVALRSN